MQNPKTEILIDDLLSVTNSLLNQLKELGISKVTIEQDFYWEIDPEQIYKLSEKPNNFVIGQISHDIERIKEMSLDDNLLVIPGLIWVGNICKNIGSLPFPKLKG